MPPRPEAWAAEPAPPASPKALAANPAAPAEAIPAPAASAPPAAEAPPENVPTCPNCGAGQWVAPDCPEHGPARKTLLDWFGAQAAGSCVPRVREESWLYRPINAGVFFGMAVGSELMEDWLGQKTGFLGGVRIGWDFDPAWGTEIRFAVGDVQLFDEYKAIAARDLETAAGTVFIDKTRFSGRDFLDASLLFYPLGDVRLRPYILFGLGYVSLRYDDLLGAHYSRGSLGIPFGVGVKYLWTDRLALRFEANDMIILGTDGAETAQDLSFTGGLEIRFGGSRRSYWPWNPGDRYW